MAENLGAVAKAKGIKYFLISYVDLFGGTRAKLVPAAAIAEMERAPMAQSKTASCSGLSPGASTTLPCWAMCSTIASMVSSV